MENGKQRQESVLAAIPGPFFHGETWYACPWCRENFEYFDTQFERGFEKVGNVYRHKSCGRLISIK